MQTNITPTPQDPTTPRPDELHTDLTAINTRLTELTGLSANVRTIEEHSARLANDISDLRRALLSRNTHHVAVRFIEEIDFDHVAEDATAALLTAAV